MDNQQSGGRISVSSSPPSPVALTLRRRERDERRRQQEQYSLGRPRPSRRLCGNDDCSLRCCRTFDTSPASLPVFLLGDSDKSVHGIPVQDILTDFAHLATTRIWPCMEKQSEVVLKARSTEAFAASPPVRAAYLDFRWLCEANDLDLAMEPRLRSVLSAAVSPFCDLVKALDAAASDGDYLERTIHGALQPPRRSDQSQTDRPQPWTEQGCVLRFLLTVELWRRHDEAHMRRRNWAWGEPRIVAELLSGVLLHYWLLDREKCFERVPCRGSEQCDEVWQEWLDKYPLLADSDDDDGDDGDDGSGGEETTTTATKGKKKAAEKSPDLVPKPIGLIKGLDLDKDIGYVGGVGTAARGPLWRDRRRKRGDGGDDDGLPQH
ncbi:hypothetical protein Trco_003209 [Trichoderma cornu-damae]|uniref:Uncharacterized protein n=1 Tax=Trichoderma cornu-damae TaxID=654480 RepID=A0A9P8TYR6_9HYPO|nr:hypothetical protein Trco_003209 [Trichoderma cornu-damae]